MNLRGAHLFAGLLISSYLGAVGYGQLQARLCPDCQSAATVKAQAKAMARAAQMRRPSPATLPLAPTTAAGTPADCRTSSQPSRLKDHP